MTSQTENTMEALQAEAKAIGVRSPHLYKKEASLRAAIDSMKPVEVVEPVAEPVAEVVRAKAPSMSVLGINNDDRAALVQKMEAEDPDLKYVFFSCGITDAELKAKGFERTDKELRSDVLCRTMKDSYDAVHAAKKDAAFESMQRIDGGTGVIESHTEQAIKPRGS